MLRVLDVQSDPAHNRSVLTLAGDASQPEDGRTGAFCKSASSRSTCEPTRASIPGSAPWTSCPFIPIEGATMADCVALAREVGAEVGGALRTARVSVRRSRLDARRGAISKTSGAASSKGSPRRCSSRSGRPTSVPAQPHPSAGATVIGARMPLIAYNINLATDRLDVAKKIAAAIRMSSGGFRFVKAMGIALEDRGIVQVSMNLTNYEKTPIFRVFETVKREAARYGVSVLESEIVGLVPSAALTQAAEFYLQLEGFSAQQVLENKLRAE